MILNCLSMQCPCFHLFHIKKNADDVTRSRLCVLSLPQCAGSRRFFFFMVILSQTTQCNICCCFSPSGGPARVHVGSNQSFDLWLVGDSCSLDLCGFGHVSWKSRIKSNFISERANVKGYRRLSNFKLLESVTTLFCHFRHFEKIELLL